MVISAFLRLTFLSGFSMCVSSLILCDVAGIGAVTASECVNEGDLRVERTRGQVHREAALVQHRGLGGEHVQVSAQARLVALHREAVRGFGGRLRLLLFVLLASNR